MKQTNDTKDIEFEEFVDELGEYAEYAQQNVLAEILADLREGHERVKEYDNSYTVHEQKGFRTYYIDNWSLWTDPLGKKFDAADADAPENMAYECLMAYLRVTQDKNNAHDVANTTLVEAL